MERKPGNVRRREDFGGPPGLARFFRGARLETMPAREPDRRAVLEHIVTRFERGRAYEEREVNSLLSDVDADFATLRRYLVDAGLLTRERNVYRRA